MKKNYSFLLVFLFLFSCSSAIFAQTTYTSIKNGNWGNSSTWTPAGVPGAGDFAIISKTVEINETHEITGFELRSGSIMFEDTASPSLTVTGNALWINGTINGGSGVHGGNAVNNTLLLAEGSTLTFGEDPESYYFLEGGTNLINRGTIILQGNTSIYARGFSIIINEGVFDLQSDANFSGSTFSGGRFLNTGLLKKSGGTDITLFDGWWNFENQGGTIEAQSGTIEIACGGIINGGIYNATEGAKLSFTSKGYIFQGTLSGTPAGTVCIDGASIDSDSLEVILNFKGTGFQLIRGDLKGLGSFIVPEGASLVLPGIASFYLNGGVNLVNRGTILKYGTSDLGIRGLSILRNESVFDIQSDAGFSGSTFSGGTFFNTGLLKKSAGTDITLFDGWWNFENQGGTIEVQSGTIEFGCGGIINGGTYNAAEEAKLIFASKGYIFQGTLSGTPAGLVCVDGASIDSDSLEVTLNFKGTGFQLIRGDINGGGTFIVPEGALLVMPGTASFYLNGGVNLVNRGTILKQGTNFLGIRGFSVVRNEGTLDIQSDAGFSGSTFSGGTFLNTGLLKKSGGTDVTTFTSWWTFENQGGSLDVQSGTLEISGACLLNGGSYSIAEEAKLSLTSNNCIFQGTLSGSPAGTFSADGASIATDSLGVSLNFKGTGFQLTRGELKGGGTFIVPEGALLIMPGTDSFYLNGGINLINRGTILKQGTANLGIRGLSVLKNENVVDIQSDAGFSGSTFSGGTFVNNGLLKKSGGSEVSAFTSWWTLQNSTNGIIDIASGTLDVSIFENEQGAIIQGTGSIKTPNAFVNDGIIAPGNSAGMLNYVSKYTSSETAALNIELGGLTAGSEHDQLVVTGATKLNGTLNVSLINDYRPVVGDSFVILTSSGAVTGNFTAINVTPGLYLDVKVNANDVTLVVDSIGNLSVDEVAILGLQLKQNHPNPFSSSTKISFEIQQNAGINGQEVSLRVYDMNGKEVANLLSKVLSPGAYEVVFDAANLPEGVYFYRLRAGNFTNTRKMVLMK